MPDQELKQKIHALLSSQMKEGEPDASGQGGSTPQRKRN